MFPRFGSRFEPEGRGFESLPVCHSVFEYLRHRRVAHQVFGPSVYGAVGASVPIVLVQSDRLPQCDGGRISFRWSQMVMCELGTVNTPAS